MQIIGSQLLRQHNKPEYDAIFEFNFELSHEIYTYNINTEFDNSVRYL